MRSGSVLPPSASGFERRSRIFPTIPRNALPSSRRSSTPSWSRFSPWFERHPDARSGCDISMSSSWAGSFSTKAGSPRCGPVRARPWSRPSPVCLNALTGRGVHVVTVNDYLARRDAEWMGKIYGFLGLTVGCIQNQMNDAERKAGLRRRHHLRHQQRVRFRLPPRQHEVRPRTDGPARPRLRHRRRGGLDPRRRGENAAHHFGSVGGLGRSLLPGRHDHPQAQEGRGDRGQTRQQGGHRRLHRRREIADGDPHRRRHGARRETPRTSRISTTRPRPICCTRSTRGCGPTPSTSAIASTSSRTARSSSSTSSPGG